MWWQAQQESCLSYPWSNMIVTSAAILWVLLFSLKTRKQSPVYVQNVKVAGLSTSTWKRPCTRTTRGLPCRRAPAKYPRAGCPVQRMPYCSETCVILADLVMKSNWLVSTQITMTAPWTPPRGSPSLPPSSWPITSTARMRAMLPNPWPMKISRLL